MEKLLEAILASLGRIEEQLTAIASASSSSSDGIAQVEHEIRVLGEELREREDEA